MSNPFSHGHFYVNPTYREHIRSTVDGLDISAADARSTRAGLEAIIDVPSAYWLDTKEHVVGKGRTDTLEGILESAARESDPPLCVFIVYNLPNRDCKALASNGRVCCSYLPDGTCDYEAQNDCADGINEYMSEYIDKIVDALQAFPQVPVALVIEPDSLPNLVTNQDDLRCASASTNAAYREGVTQAIAALHAVPSVSLYLDAGHGGWLGWSEQAEKFAALLAEMDVLQMLRGFSVNVANYQPLGTPCPATSFPLHEYCKRDGGREPPACCRDECGLIEQWSDGNNELNYAQMLAGHLREHGMPSPRFIIDTGRNGMDDMREDCSNWCNVRGAGLGLWPTADTALPGLVDAYYWLKTPGESDGCTAHLPDGSSCPRYDSSCGSVDSLGSRYGEPFAPEAGQWFSSQAAQLASHQHIRVQSNEVLGLTHSPSPPPRWTRPPRPATASPPLPPPPPPPPPPRLRKAVGARAPGASDGGLMVAVLLLLVVALLIPIVCFVRNGRSWWRQLRGRTPLTTKDASGACAELEQGVAEHEPEPETPEPPEDGEARRGEMREARMALRATVVSSCDLD